MKMGNAGAPAAGIILNNDRAGDSNLGVTDISIVFSLSRTAGSDSSHRISAGLKAGMGQRSIDYSNLTFDEQFNGDSYDPNAPTGETFGTNSITFPDVSAGFNWLYAPKKSFRVSAGAGLHHINTPEQSFLGDKKERLRRKLLLHGQALFEDVYPGLDAVPAFMAARQNSFSEIMAGGFLVYSMKLAKGQQTAFRLGSFYRNRDALLIVAGMDYEGVSAGISYDANLSGLRPASHGRGGFEISVIYIIRQFRPLNVKNPLCPVYL